MIMLLVTFSGSEPEEDDDLDHRTENQVAISD